MLDACNCLILVIRAVLTVLILNSPITGKCFKMVPKRFFRHKTTKQTNQHVWNGEVKG